MNKIKLRDIKIILRNYTIIIIPIFIISILINNYISKFEIDKTKEAIIEEQKHKSKIINYVIEDKLKDIKESILVVKNSDEMNKYINNQNNYNLSETENLFLRILDSKKGFEQLRFIDNKGKEVIRVNNQNGKPKLMPEYELQDKSDRYYYIHTSKFKDSEIYVSKMDLNIENGEIEEPYKPIVRIATPLFSKDGTYKGILISNYLSQELLNIFEESFNDTEYNFVEQYLVDNEGYYLYNKDQDKRFGFMFDGKEKDSIFFEDEELCNKINSKDTGTYENNDEISFFINLDKLNWTIVSQFNLNDLALVQDNIILGLKHRDILILSGTSILLLIIVIISHFFKRDKEQLNLRESIASNTNDAVVITNKDTEIIYVNNSFEKITGYKKEEVLGIKTNMFKSGNHKNEFYKNMWQDINKKGYWTGELWDKRKDGILYPKKLSIFKVKDKFRQDNLKYVGISTDLTELKREQEYTDKLKDYNIDTNLPNENLLIRLINNSIEKNKDKFYIMYFSIENYNSILLSFKDDYHICIKFLIERINKMINQDDFIAQINSSKFVMFLSSIESKIEMDNFLNDFFRQNNKSFYINNKEIFYEIKSGIVSYPKGGKSPNELMINAYMALEKAIDTKGINYIYYSEYLKEKIQKEMEINLLLRKAIENDELYVYYQPQIDVATGSIVGAEALIRWKNKKYGIISPAIFIPVAEKTGQIIEIGYFIIERVFKDYVKLKDKLNEEFRFSINISPLEFNDKELLPKFKEYIEKYKVDATKMEIEITENLFIEDITNINKKLKELKELGMTIAIDDFGTGFSSLSYIRNLNVDKLKIDIAFIKDYPEKDDGEMADIITNIAHKLNLEVIAEGAETREQVDYLKSIGCNLVQGYYYSKPLERNEFEEYLSNDVE